MARIIAFDKFKWDVKKVNNHNSRLIVFVIFSIALKINSGVPTFFQKKTQGFLINFTTSVSTHLL